MSRHFCERLQVHLIADFPTVRACLTKPLCYFYHCYQPLRRSVNMTGGLVSGPARDAAQVRAKGRHRPVLQLACPTPGPSADGSWSGRAAQHRLNRDVRLRHAVV